MFDQTRYQVEKLGSKLKSGSIEVAKKVKDTVNPGGGKDDRSLSLRFSRTQSAHGVTPFPFASEDYNPAFVGPDCDSVRAWWTPPTSNKVVERHVPCQIAPSTTSPIEIRDVTRPCTPHTDIIFTPYTSDYGHPSPTIPETPNSTLLRRMSTYTVRTMSTFGENILTRSRSITESIDSQGKVAWTSGKRQGKAAVQFVNSRGHATIKVTREKVKKPYVRVRKSVKIAKMRRYKRDLRRREDELCEDGWTIVNWQDIAREEMRRDVWSEW